MSIKGTLYFETGRATTEYGHSIVTMFERIAPDIQADLPACSREVDAEVDLRKQLTKHDGIFVSVRNWYEPQAPWSLGSDVVYFARPRSVTQYFFSE
jgi:hypothetical protein